MNCSVFDSCDDGTVSHNFTVNSTSRISVLHVYEMSFMQYVSLDGFANAKSKFCCVHTYMTLADAEAQVGAECSYGEVVRVLQNITDWPKEDTRYGHPASMFCIGSNDNTVGSEYPSLSRMIIDFCKTMMRLSGAIISFNCVRVDFNHTQRRLVKEKRGQCAFIGVGTFTGGELQIETEFFITINRLVVYDSGLPHAHRYFRGKRFGITCFLASDSSAEVHFKSTPFYRHINFSMCISILSRDLGCFNTYINTELERLELSYKRQGIWALKVDDDLKISERHLYDTYFKSEPFESKDWGATIYTVSDTACAASRPLPSSFYNHFLTEHGLYIPRIDYRTPFVIFVSKRWGHGVMVGSRRLPFSATMYFNGDSLQLACSTAMYNSAQSVLFD